MLLIGVMYVECPHSTRTVWKTPQIKEETIEDNRVTHETTLKSPIMLP